MAKESSNIIPLHGTKFGLEHYSHGWAVYERVKRDKCKRLEGMPVEDHYEWDNPHYPANFKQAAEYIVDKIGGKATDLKSMLTEIVAERKRLEKIVTELISATVEETV